MTNAQLTARYNELATLLEIATIAMWKNKKEILQTKIAELEVRVKALQAPAPKAKSKKPARERKTPVNKVNAEYVAYLKRVQTEQPDADHATQLRILFNHFKGATRIEFKHSAAAAGINPLTARNMFDKLNKS